MKRIEIYQHPKLEDTEKERNIDIDVNNFLRKNYIDLETSPSMQYLHKEKDSLILITHGEGICNNKIVNIQITPKETEVPKELSDLLNSKGFIRVQK